MIILIQTGAWISSVQHSIFMDARQWKWLNMSHASHYVFGLSTWQRQIVCFSAVKGPTMLSSGSPCIQLHIQIQLQPWLQASTKGNPWHSNLLETFPKLCVFVCAHAQVCPSRLNRSNMWSQLESRRLSYPLLRWLKSQSQKEHNMNFWLFSWGTIKRQKVKTENQPCHVLEATNAKLHTALVC